MKYIAALALILNVATASSYGQEIPVRMTFSGTGGASPIDLKQPNTHTAKEDVSGFGTLGAFTYRGIRASAAAPESSSTCMGGYFPSTSGAALIRFQGGSVLKLALMQGGDCIDFVNIVGHCVLTFKITGGTGRFKNATGVLTYTETALPLLGDGTNNPVYFSETGEITGTISGVAEEPQAQEEPR